MKKLLLLTIALSACVADTTGTTASELGLKPDGSSGNHFYWAAYSKVPYIYKGCPDPGPEPWAEVATLYAPAGTREIDLQLGTAVPLGVRGLEVPRGMQIVGNEAGARMAVDMFHPDLMRFSLLVTSGRCSYELDAEVQFEPN